MKINDLMIGDFITFGSEIHKVLTVDADGVLFLDGCDDSIPIGLIEPVPITNDFLKKNFKLHIEPHYIEWRSEDRRVTINDLSNMEDRDWYCHIDNESFETIGGADIQYVHELQHLLRLCGIDKEIVL